MRTFQIFLLIAVCFLAGTIAADLIDPVVLSRRVAPGPRAAVGERELNSAGDRDGDLQKRHQVECVVVQD